ncbi:hypothetical protein Tco_1237150 [Tanacetum coccineum]
MDTLKNTWDPSMIESPSKAFRSKVEHQAARDAYDALYDTHNEVACLMLGSMFPNLQRALENYKAYDMIQELKTMFEEQAKQELFETVKVFHACKQEDGLILNSLNNDYDQFVQNYNMHSMGKTIAKLHTMLKLHEKGAKGKDKGKTKLAYAPKPKISPSTKRDNLAKDSICHHCHEVGHWRRNYPSYHVELKKRKNASIASTSDIFTIELYAFPNKTWVYDTGCETHICNTLQGLKESMKLKHGSLSLYIGNGMRVAVEAIRSFDLVLPSGLIILTWVQQTIHGSENADMGTADKSDASTADGSVSTHGETVVKLKATTKNEDKATE